MRRTAMALARLGLVVLLVAPGAAHAALGTDNAPAATLLLPYFEVQLPKKPDGKPKGVTTLFSITNASATAELVKVTLWSDLAVAVFNFNVFLTGYDVQTVDLQDLLVNGHVPQTGASLVGNGCQDFLPPFSPLDSDTRAHLRAYLTGKPSPLTAQCAGRDFGEKTPVARGYVTIDTVTQCNASDPTDPSYFATGGLGTASGDNVLFGDYVIVDRQKKLGIGDLLVHLEAFTSAFGPDSPTFYARFVAHLALDQREPLPATYGFRYLNAPKDKLFPQGTTVTVWRDPLLADAQPFPCGTMPLWFPLQTAQITVFDEDENPFNVGQQPFAAATQRVKVGGLAFPVPFERGWIYLSLHDSFSPFEQGWVTVFHESKGRNSVTTRAVSFE